MGDRGHFCDSMWPSRELGGSVGMHSREKWAGRTFMPNILVFDDQLATATPCTDVQKVLSLGGNKFRRSEILNCPDGVASRTQLGVLWDELLSLAL